MQIEPSADAFAKRYARGEAQVVWTTLVSDLETPVSAFLKIAGGQPMSFLLESVEGGAVRGRYSVIGLKPDLIWRANGTHAEINRAAQSETATFVRMSSSLRSRRCAHSSPRVASTLPDNLPPMAAGVFGYLGYDMVRPDGGIARAQSRSARHSRRDADTADDCRRVRCGQGYDHRGHAGAASSRASPQRRARRAHRTALRHCRRARPSARQGGVALDPGTARRCLDLEHDASRISRHGAQGQGIHPRRRYFSGGALATL